MKLDDVLEHYSPAFLQDFRTVVTALKEEGLTLAEIVEKTDAFFNEVILASYELAAERDKYFRDFKYNAKRCGACGSIMNPFEVNHKPAAMVGGGFKSSWVCSDSMGCGEVEYSELSMQEELEKYNLSPFYAGVPPPPPDANKRRMAASYRARAMKPREFRIKNKRR